MPCIKHHTKRELRATPNTKKKTDFVASTISSSIILRGD